MFKHKVRSRHNIGLFVTLIVVATLGVAFFYNPTITGASVMESGAVDSFEPIFVLVFGIIFLILLSIFWWWLKKKK
jgi:hypothetical protein